MNKRDKDYWKKTKLEDIPGFFINERIRKVLEISNIYTIGEFLNISSYSYFITWFGTSPLVLKDISATIKLLRCKYLNEDPKIIINDDMYIEEIINKLGLSLETEYELLKMNRDKHFFKNLSNLSLKEKKKYFKENSNMNKISINEITIRLQIINDYEKYKEELIKNGNNDSEYIEPSIKRAMELRNIVNLLSRSNTDEEETKNKCL